MTRLVAGVALLIVGLVLTVQPVIGGIAAGAVPAIAVGAGLLTSSLLNALGVE